MVQYLHIKFCFALSDTKMKKTCLVAIFISVLCVFSMCIGTLGAFSHIQVAQASETQNHNATYRHPSGRFALTSLNSNGKVVGVRFSGYYFGNSGIPVVAEIYSSDVLTLDFYMGDADYVPQANRDPLKSYLSAEQTAVKHEIIETFTTIDELVNRVDACANTQYNGTNNLPLSDIFRYNAAAQGETLEISRETYEMLQIAKEMYRDTNGAFNPAVYRLVDLWGFSSRIYSNGAFDTAQYPYDRPVTGEYFSQNGYPLPAQKYIEAFSTPNFTDFSDNAVNLFEEDGKYFVVKNVAPAVVDGVEFQQWLDLGGIAKGYVVDEITTLLQSKFGVERYYIDAGSSSSAYGYGFDGDETLLALQDPETLFEALLGWKVGKCSVSTSGQYIRKYVTNGVEYSHIIDGTTGAPAQTGVKAVLVSVPQSEGLWAGKSDCLTTALTVMGKDKIVDFVNGYLKDHGISVVVVFETFDGKKEICSNLETDKIALKGTNFNSYAWALKQNDSGNFVYDGNATFVTQKQDAYQTLIIVLACICGVGVVALVVYHIVKGKKSALQNVRYARHDKPFKPADIGVYLLVILLIVVLFSAFLGGGNNSVQTVQAVDIQTGEQLFLYNVLRNEFKINDKNSSNWQISVEQLQNGVKVTFSRTINGEEHFNVLQISRGSTPTVKMVDSRCGYHQDCVYNFDEITKTGGVIVCSPNRLKIITD